MSFPPVPSPERRDARSRRARRAVLRIALLPCIGILASASATDAPAAVEPLLQLGESRFPELLLHVPRFDHTGSRLAIACDQIRARRIDELDPTWRQAVGRVHLECEPLPATGDGEPQAIATVVTAYLKPGTAVFLQAPVVEVRLMDSDLWSDHQYVLAAPYLEVVDDLRRHLVARCEAAPLDKAILFRRDCAVKRNDDGIFVASSALGGAWAHPDPFDARRTVYAEGWAE